MKPFPYLREILIAVFTSVGIFVAFLIHDKTLNHSGDGLGNSMLIGLIAGLIILAQVIRLIVLSFAKDKRYANIILIHLLFVMLYGAMLMT